MKKILSVLLVLAMVCAGTAALADAPYTPGTYTVSVDGHNGEICLAVEMTADAIASIKVLSHSETTGLGDVAMDKVIAAIVAVILAGVGCGTYMIMMGLDFTPKIGVEIVVLMYLSFLVSTVGYDKVIQTLKQIHSVKEG